MFKTEHTINHLKLGGWVWKASTVTSILFTSRQSAASERSNHTRNTHADWTRIARAIYVNIQSRDVCKLGRRVYSARVVSHQ